MLLWLRRIAFFNPLNPSVVLLGDAPPFDGATGMSSIPYFAAVRWASARIALWLYISTASRGCSAAM
jgi:hypothetical protein